MWEQENHGAPLGLIKGVSQIYNPLLFQSLTGGEIRTIIISVSVQGVKSLGGHFACLCWGFEFYKVNGFFFVIIFQKENGKLLHF